MDPNQDDSDDDKEHEPQQRQEDSHHESTTVEDSKQNYTLHEVEKQDGETHNNENTVASDITIPQPVVLTPHVESVTSPEVNLDTQNDTQPKNEIIEPQTIIIDDKPTVRFGEFDAVFDSDHPMDSDMIYEPKDGEGEDDEVPALEILDENSAPLVDGLDFDDLEDNNDKPEALKADEYDEI